MSSTSSCSNADDLWVLEPENTILKEAGINDSIEDSMELIDAFFPVLNQRCSHDSDRLDEIDEKFYEEAKKYNKETTKKNNDEKSKYEEDKKIRNLLIFLHLLCAISLSMYTNFLVKVLTSNKVLTLAELMNELQQNVYACIGQEQFLFKHSSFVLEEKNYLVCEDQAGEYLPKFQKYMSMKNVADFLSFAQMLYLEDKQPDLTTLTDENISNINFELLIRQMQSSNLLPPIINDTDISSEAVAEKVTALNFKAQLSQMQGTIFSFAMLNRQLLDKIVAPEQCGARVTEPTNSIPLEDGDFIPEGLANIQSALKPLKMLLDESIAQLNRVQELSVCSPNGTLTVFQKVTLYVSNAKGLLNNCLKAYQKIFYSYYEALQPFKFFLTTDNVLSLTTITLLFIFFGIAWFFFGVNTGVYIKVIFLQLIVFLSYLSFSEA